MPLPDERPRQSVANLIGRFEKQKSSSGPSLPPISFARTSSVASQRTDDSAAEEIKEKREWPPKSVENKSSPAVQVSEKRLFSTTLRPPTTNEKSAELASSNPAAIPKPSSSSPQQSPALQSTPAKDTSPPIETTPVRSSSPSLAQIKSASARTSTSVKSPIPKAPAKEVPEAPFKTQTLGESAPLSSTPSKSQHTNQATASAHTANRIASKGRTPVPNPARSRTPSSTPRAKTPSSSPRPKSPLPPVRSKTPSGLYAPTASSLARSKAGVPAPPAPEKPKRKITTDLSKPTAASASRIRTPVVVPSPKVGKTSAVKQTVTKTAVKTTVSSASTPPKRLAAAKPRSSQGASVDNGKGSAKKSGSGIVALAGNAGVAIGTAVSQMKTEDLGDSPPDVPGATVLDVSDITEGESYDTDHAAETHGTIATDEEHLELEAQPASHHDDDIENYDEDFPDDIPQETLEHENGHAVAEDADSIPLVEEPAEGHDTEPKSSLHDDNLSESQHEAQRDAQDLSQSHSFSFDVSSQVRQEGTADHGSMGGLPHEDSKGSEVGSDVEDIGNLLESGPQIQRPSLESSSSKGTVSEPGDIPDEY